MTEQEWAAIEREALFNQWYLHRPRWGACESCGTEDYLRVEGGLMACILCRREATYDRLRYHMAQCYERQAKQAFLRYVALPSTPRGFWARVRAAWRALTD